jgi:hypothetical protein
MELSEVTDLMSTVAASLRAPVNPDEGLAQITASAADTISGVRHASISVTTKDGSIRTLAPTSSLAVAADELQYELGEGPCVRAALGEPVVRVDDIATDTRWPLYGPKAAALGLRAQLSFQFRADPDVRGALNLYADEPDVFDADAQFIAAMFADWTAVLLGWHKQEVSLSEALETRNLIGTAIGILMERYKLDHDRAFAFLVRLSSSGNVKLRDIAAGVVADARKNAE